MRKYFDQDFKTKFSKQTMASELGFQWVIEEMENEFEYPENDINTFNSFFTILAHYNLHIEYFIRIYEIDKDNLNINNEFVNILSKIAKFALKEISIKEVLKDNKYKNFTILYLLGLIACFVQKTRRVGTYDFGMYVYYNWFELHEIKNMSNKNKRSIDSLIKKLTILEKNKILDIYSKNFNEIKENYKEKNLICLKKYDKLFKNIGYKRNQFCTWQEDYILNMSRLHFSISKIIPCFSSDDSKFPNYDLWNREIIDNMKDFFKTNQDALVVLEIIDFRLNNKNLDIKTQRIVLTQILRIIRNKTIIRDYDNIWFYILIKYMKEKDNYIRNNLNQIYIAIKKKRNINIILFLKENGFHIDKDLQKKIDRFHKKQIKTIEKIENINFFNHLLKEPYLITNINIELVKKIRNVFLNLINKYENNIQTSMVFFDMLNFLVEVKLKLKDDLIGEYIFEILDLWKNKYYIKMKSLLVHRTYEDKIETSKVKNYNKMFIEFPSICLKNEFSWKEYGILERISIFSEHAIVTITKPKSIFIDEFLPYYKKIDLKQKDSYDNILIQYLGIVQKKYEEQLLNPNINPKEYLYSLYGYQNQLLTMFISFIDEDNYKNIYEYIQKSFTKYKLLDYPQDINMAHITQLIPLLELLIRELGIKNKVLPFKEVKNQIHVMKDSSTILLSIIKKGYKENKNFENLEVYMFLYNYLYNVNSLNLRNELMHARKYLENSSEMLFSFRVLLIGIFWALLELYL